MFTAKQFQQKLLGWFDKHGRKDLPWQHNKTPYSVWVSEIMLQQTQVATVIPYYARFMKTFPTLKHLANSELEAVLHLWTGLGYYTRAKNLHKAAQLVQSLYRGKLPNTLESLVSLPGIGPSTAGAILASAFNQHATILDGNVKRVLTRLYGLTSPVTEKDTEMRLWEIATTLTPHDRIADYTQAMMDLGATLCTRSKPSCGICPIKTKCQALQHHIVDQIPAKTRKKPLPVKQTSFLILQYKNQILLEKRMTKGVWQGLWSFPEHPEPGNLSHLKKTIGDTFSLKITSADTMEAFRHTFSHYHLDITPIHFIIKTNTHKIASDHYLWYSLDTPNAIGLPQPVKRLLEQLTHANHLLPKTAKRSRRA